VAATTTLGSCKGNVTPWPGYSGSAGRYDDVWFWCVCAAGLRTLDYTKSIEQCCSL